MLRAPEELVPEVGISALSAGASLPRDAEAGGKGSEKRSCWDNSDLDVLWNVQSYDVLDSDSAMIAVSSP